MGYIHSFKNPGDGNFYLATESGVPKLHSYQQTSEIDINLYQSGSDVILTIEGSLHEPQTYQTPCYDGGSSYAYMVPDTAKFDLFGPANCNFVFTNAYRVAYSLVAGNTKLPDLGVAQVKGSATHYTSLSQRIYIDKDQILVPSDYVWGTSFSETVTFSNTTLVNMGVDTYGSWTAKYGSLDYNVNLTVVTPPTPTPSATNTPTPTQTPVASPTPTPTLSVTPTPSAQNQAVFGVYGMTNDNTGLTGTGDTAGFDDGGYTYSFQQISSNASVYIGNGIYWINDSVSSQNFPIGVVAARGDVSNNAHFFRPYVAGYPGVTVSCPYTNKKKVWLLAAGVDGGGTINYTYTYRDVATNAYYTTSVNSVQMDDWCAGSTSQDVAVSMSHRNNAGGGFQSLTARIYRYELTSISSGYEIKSISFGNNSNGNKCRIVSIGWADA